MPQQSKSSQAYNKRQQTLAVLKQFESSASSLVSTPAASPLHVWVNVWAWNGGERVGRASRVGLHPSQGVHSWRSVVAQLFAACGGGASDDVVYSCAGVQIRNYSAFLSEYVAEKERHSARWKYLCDKAASTNSKFAGPFAPVPCKPEDDAVDRVYHFDAICCPRGTPFSVPDVLRKKLKRREAMDNAIVEHISFAAENVAIKGTAVSPLQCRATRKAGSAGSTGVIMAGFAHFAKRKDNALLVRSLDTELTSSHVAEEQMQSDAELERSGLLLKSSAALRRLSSTNALLTKGNSINERAMQMRTDLLSSLRKEEVIDGALNIGEVEELQRSMLARRESLGGGTASPWTRQAESPSSAAVSPLRKVSFVAKFLRGVTPSSSDRAASAPLAPAPGAGHALRSFSPQTIHSTSAASSETGSGPSSPTSPSPSRSAVHSVRRHNAASIPFPLGVVKNRHGELIKIDGGPVCPGALATSSATGELFRVEWVDVKSNVAHCRWVVRAVDPYLEHFVRCSENSFSQRLHLGDHFMKYRHHWLRRMAVGARSSGNPPAALVLPAAPHEPSDVDDSMIQYGDVPLLSAHDYPRHRHHASPMQQRRRLRHGAAFGDSSSSSGDEEDDDPNRVPEMHGDDAAVIKDFESLFPSHRDRDLLGKDVLSKSPSVTVSRQVSFLTDVCVAVKLSNLKPTTTFRFLLWIDVGFVVSLKRLQQQYNGGAQRDVDCALPLSEVDVTGTSAAFAALPVFHNRTQELYMHADPVESCFSHESSTMSTLSVDPSSCLLMEHSTGQRACCVCGESTEAAQPTQDEQGEVTLVM